MSNVIAFPATTSTATIDLSFDITLIATYRGGAYIDVGLLGLNPSEVINVWDYEAGRATIPNTPAAVEQALIVWAGEYDEDAPDAIASFHTLADDVRNHW